MSPEHFASLLSDYERDGIVRLPRFFTAKEQATLRRQIDRYRATLLPTLPPADYVLETDGKIVRNLWRMENHDPFFAALAREPKLLELVTPLLHGTPVLMGVETFSKQPRVGSAVPYHQDNAYFCRTPPDALTVWVAIDEATPANGCVEYLIGSHAALLPHQPSGVKGNSMGLCQEPLDDAFAPFQATAEPGDVLIHHCQIIHRSAPNLSDRAREGLLLVYRGAHAQTDERLLSEYRRAMS